MRSLHEAEDAFVAITLSEEDALSSWAAASCWVWGWRWLRTCWTSLPSRQASHRCY